MRLVWLPGAARSRTSQLDYVADRNPRAALAAGDRLAQAVGALAGFPERGRPGRVAGTRELVVTGTPFIVVNRLQADTVVVLRVLHGAQRWPPAGA